MSTPPPMSEPLYTPSPNLIALMDVLWFQQIILLSSSQPMNITTTISTSTALLDLKTTTSSPIPPMSSPSHSSYLDDDDDDDEALDVSSSGSSPVLAQDIEEDEEELMKYKRKRPTRLSLVIESNNNKTRSQSSSPSIHQLPKHLRNMGGEDDQVLSSSGMRKSRSCKSLAELEYEEVKGFMDLGFTFKEDQLSPRMMSVIPGLQRLIRSSSTSTDDDHDHQQALIMDDQEKSTINNSSTITRPYLSEAWLIKRPDSPLLNLRIPRRIKGSSDDMKKHLRSWARTVASAIQLEY